MALKKYWYIIVLFLITAGLGVMVFLTTQQISKRQPISQPPSQAVVPACTITFSIGSTPTQTPTPTLPPGVTPTETPTPTLPPGVTPTETPTPTLPPGVTPTNTPVVTCNEPCTVNTDCGGGLVCLDNVCRNPSCFEEADCLCEDVAIAVAPTPKIPVAGAGPSFIGALSIGGGLLLLLLGLIL